MNLPALRPPMIFGVLRLALVSVDGGPLTVNLRGFSMKYVTLLTPILLRDDNLL